MANKLNTLSLHLEKICQEYEGNTVLDVGSGHGDHREIFRKYGKQVTGIDIQRAYDPEICAEFISHDFNGQQFDWIWASHVLEHQLNVNLFLRKIKKLALKYIMISVPEYTPERCRIVGGHYTWWNMGLLIYNMIMAGINCRELRGKVFDRNITVIVPVEEMPDPRTISLNYDVGDIELLRAYFPKRSDRLYEQSFDGYIKEV